jgi:hypothetical protein
MQVCLESYSLTTTLGIMMCVMPWTMTRRCPFCGSTNVHRSQRYDSFERVWLTLLLQRPFRCLKCEERHYNFIFSKRAPREEIQPESSREEAIGRDPLGRDQPELTDHEKSDEIHARSQSNSG